MKHLTRTTLAVAAAFCTVSLPAQAHFQLLYTPKVMLEKHGKIPLKLVFSHPMENGHTMDMGKPEQFFVMLKDDKKEDLLSTLEEVSWQGSKNKGKAYSTTYPVKLNGDYVFALVPAPYFEESEGAFIQQITKTYVKDVTEGLQAFMRDLKALGAIVNFEVYPDPELNTASQLEQGRVYWNIRFTDVPPAENPQFRVEVTNQWITEVLDINN